MNGIAVFGYGARLIHTLGYGGCADRREFAAGAALTLVGPQALSLAIRGSVDRIFSALPPTVALITAIVLTVVVCLAVVAWFWLWSVLLTRRARDIGLPAWTGVASLPVLGMLGAGLEGLFTPPVSGLASAALLTIWFFGWALWPGVGRPFLPRRQSAEASAAA